MKPPEIVSCPECAASAEVVDRDWLGSTAGPVEHARVRCVRRHWFIMPVESLTAPADPSEPDVLTEPGDRTGIVS